MDLSLRKATLLVAVAALVALAGCNLGGQGTATPGANSTATPTDSLEPMSELNGSELTADTTAAVEDAGSYTRRVDANITSNSSAGASRSNATVTTRVDFEAERGLRITDQSVSYPTLSGTARTSVFTDGNASYRRQNSSLSGLSYDTQTGRRTAPGGIRPVNVTGFDRTYTDVSNLTRSFDWQANGTTTVGEARTIRYSSTNVTNATRLLGTADPTLTNASADIYVDADGVVRRLDIAYTTAADNATTRADITVTLTDVGSTTVEDPDWLDEAQSSTATETPA